MAIAKNKKIFVSFGINIIHATKVPYNATVDELKITFL
jgi:hypothetical protein